MNIEDRVRDTLRERAETVPPSPNARADLDRRLRQRGHRRGSALTAAAVVAVLAGVAVPVALNQPDGPPGGRAATTSPAPSGEPEVLAGPVVISEFSMDGIQWREVLTVERFENETISVVCGRTVSPGHPDSGTGGCHPVPRVWPLPVYSGQLDGAKGWVNPEATYSEQRPNQWLTLAAPQVKTLEFRLADGTPVPARLVLATSDVKAFVTETEGGFASQRGYTAKDAHGKVLESVVG